MLELSVIKGCSSFNFIALPLLIVNSASAIIYVFSFVLPDTFIVLHSIRRLKRLRSRRQPRITLIWSFSGFEKNILLYSPSK